MDNPYCSCKPLTRVRQVNTRKEWLGRFEHAAPAPSLQLPSLPTLLEWHLSSAGGAAAGRVPHSAPEAVNTAIRQAAGTPQRPKPPPRVPRTAVVPQSSRWQDPGSVAVGGPQEGGADAGRWETMPQEVGRTMLEPMPAGTTSRPAQSAAAAAALAGEGMAAVWLKEQSVSAYSSCSTHGLLSNTMALITSGSVLFRSLARPTWPCSSGV